MLPLGDRCDRSKYQAHAVHLHPAHTFVPASIETYRHIGRSIMRYIRTLSDIASARSLAVTRGSFLASAHRELSVALCAESVRVLCTDLAHCCSPKLRRGRYCQGGHSFPCLSVQLSVQCPRVGCTLFFCVWLSVVSVAFGSVCSLSLIVNCCGCFPRPCRL
jgi:hypothetical protein